MALYRPGQNTTLNQVILFATMVHGSQVRKGNEHLPYIVHPLDVMQEVIYYSGLSVEKLALAGPVAALHDTVEDTVATIEQIEEQFGKEIAQGVAALTKNEELDWEERKADSLKRLKASPNWVKCVKLADRVSNLKNFPAMWDRKKIEEYLKEAEDLAEALGSASVGLKARLLSRVSEARMILSIRG